MFCYSNANDAINFEANNNNENNKDMSNIDEISDKIFIFNNYDRIILMFIVIIWIIINIILIYCIIKRIIIYKETEYKYKSTEEMELNNDNEYI